MPVNDERRGSSLLAAFTEYVVQAVAQRKTYRVGDVGVEALKGVDFADPAWEIDDLLCRLRRVQDETMVIVTDAREVAERADRVVRMRDGRIVEPAVHGFGKEPPALAPAASSRR